VSDLSPRIDPAATDRLLAHVDVERKLLRAIASLGPVVDRDVLIVDGRPGSIAAMLADAGARVTVSTDDEAALTALDGRVARVVRGTSRETALPDGSIDVVIGMHSVYRGIDAAEQTEADRVLRDGGRLLVIHDYGRDDLAPLAPAELPEFAEWSRRGGPFLRAGFRLRVIHCWWTFPDTDQAGDILTAAFGPEGAAVASGLRRPRLAHNLAIYHRDRAAASMPAASPSARRRARAHPSAAARPSSMAGGSTGRSLLRCRA
jgi:hypothetical protein